MKPLTISFRICPTDPTRIQIRDADGKVYATADIPTGYRMAIVRPPWWIRLRYWTKLQLWRARGAWGQS